ncbi:hypothetical protein WN944_024121 [Citrus x changshan-huyou]|uniref:Uncharacterized protein n=1 Tax=Citrus x changshan-huyou TaxID=2935761 RepID=A0AAP0LME2_9ROSI
MIVCIPCMLRYLLVDAKICSSSVRPDLHTNVCSINNEDVSLSLLQRSLLLPTLDFSFFFSLCMRSQKYVRDAGGFAGVNPPMPKLAQGIYGKTVQLRFQQLFRIGSLLVPERGLDTIRQSFPFSQFFLPILHRFLSLL